MFNEKQIKSLTNELDSKRIKSRQKGNITLSYLEGFDILEAANKIFGFGNWSYRINKLEQVSQEVNSNKNNLICYKSIVQVSVYNLSHTVHISREDVGFGTGIAKTLADAHESGAKEAVTDAIKRAMRSFGNNFGNSLYDKSRQHQNTQQSTQSQPAQLTQQIQNNAPQDYLALQNLGLTILAQGKNLVVIGEDIFSKKDTIKACGFHWDATHRVWYKPNNAQKAA